MAGNHSTARYATALIALATVLASIPFGASTALSSEQWLRNGTFKASVDASPSGGAGWQDYVTEDVPQHEKNLVFTYSCPDAAPTPVANSFSPTEQARRGLILTASFRPTNAKNSWEWQIFWTSGAPINSQIKFNIYCAQ